MSGSLKNWVKPLIVAVDDNELYLEVISSYIEQRGYRVITTSSPYMAREIVNDLTGPVVFLVDYRMPKMSGLELIPKLKEITQWPIEFVLVSADDNPEIHGAAKRMGIDFYQKGMRPPYNVEKLLLDYVSCAEMRLKERSARERDPVTQAYTKTGGDLQFLHIWNRAAREKTPIACIYADLNNFKSINDVFGHDAGDEVLRSVVVTIRHQLRRIDIVVKMGDEIYILLPGTGLEDARIIGERIKAEVAKILISVAPGVNVMTSLSLGTSVLLPSDLTSLTKEEADDVNIQIEASLKDLKKLKKEADIGQYVDKLEHYKRLVESGATDEETLKKLSYYKKIAEKRSALP